MKSADHRPFVLEDHVARILPVERALIGACLWPKEAAGSPLPPLLVQEFYLEGHRLIWRAMQELEVQGREVMIVALHDELERAGDLEAAGGPAHLALCFEEGHISSYVPQLVRLVRRGARERALVALGEEMARQGLPEEEIERRLAELPASLTGALYDPAENWSELVEDWQKRGRIWTGFEGLDTFSGGFGPGDFAIVGGRTSHGKTAWLTALAMNLAERGVVVEYVTLEETATAITRRLIGKRAGVAVRRLKDGGDLTQEEFEQCESAVRWLQTLPLTVADMEHVRNLEEQTVVGMVGASKAAVVIVDHLQQIITVGKESRVYGLERVLRRLQAVALRDEKVVILAAQLNRQTEERQGQPRLSDLRDCGAIEQSGRQILLLYWPCKHDRERAEWEYELFVAKNADGGTGLVPLHFDAPTGRFTERAA
jgi:replicative DNA helicase